MVSETCGAAEQWEHLTGGLPEMRKVAVDRDSRGSIV